jgi:hypothetical protein
MLIEELDAAQGDGTGTARVVFDVFEVEEILTQFFLRDPVGGLVVMFSQLADSPDIHLLSPCRHPSELQILDHPLLQCCHSNTSCAGVLTVLHRRDSLKKMAEESSRMTAEEGRSKNCTERFVQPRYAGDGFRARLLLSLSKKSKKRTSSVKSPMGSTPSVASSGRSDVPPYAR